MQVQKAALYDFLFCCSDRHSQNVFVDEHANLKLIDNDLLLGGAQRGRDGKGSCSPRLGRPLTCTRIPCVADHCVSRRSRLWQRPALHHSDTTVTIMDRLPSTTYSRSPPTQNPHLSAVGVRVCLAVGVRVCLHTARCSSRAT